MPAKKRVTTRENETTSVHYGIDRDTLQVVIVFQTRSGRLSNDAGKTHRSGSRFAANELVAVFNLRDIRTVPVLLHQSAGDRLLAEWEARATALRTERAIPGDKTGADPSEVTGAPRIQ